MSRRSSKKKKGISTANAAAAIEKIGHQASLLLLENSAAADFELSAPPDFLLVASFAYSLRAQAYPELLSVFPQPPGWPTLNAGRSGTSPHFDFIYI